MSEGVTEIEWKNPATLKDSKVMKEMNNEAESPGISCVRENDLLSHSLGPEQPGRVRGVSSTSGWKHGFLGCSDMYQKGKGQTL